MALERPLLVDTDRIQPMTDKDLYDSECAHCRQTRARWLFYTTDGDDKALLMCSICWLYDSNWAKDRREDLDALIEDTETEMEELFARDDSGKMTRGSDGDRIMGAIVYLSRMMQMRGALEALRK